MFSNEGRVLAKAGEPKKNARYYYSGVAIEYIKRDDKVKEI